MSRRVTRFRIGEDEFAVLSIPLPHRWILSSLTPAEREVVQMMLAGLSNATIASRRRRSPNTVANQVRSLFTKLGVSSRSELAKLASTSR